MPEQGYNFREIPTGTLFEHFPADDNIIPRYHDGNATPEEREEIELHLEQCGSCMQEFNQMREFLSDYRNSNTVQEDPKN